MTTNIYKDYYNNKHMKITIKIDIDDDTSKLIINNRLREWLMDNFQKGAESIIDIEEN